MDNTTSAQIHLTMAIFYSNIRGRFFLALLLSLTAHSFLIFFVGARPLLSHSTKSNEGIAEKTLHVRLLHQETGSRPGKRFIKVTTQNEEKTIPSLNPSPIAEPQPTSSPLRFEIEMRSLPHYFLPGELTVKPIIVRDVDPSLALALSGVPPQAVVLRLQINERGDIDHVIVGESAFSESEQRLIVDAFEKTKFKPGEIEGKPVKSELKIEFKLEKALPAIYQKSVVSQGFSENVICAA